MNQATARAFITAAQTLADTTSPHGADWAWIQHTLMRQTTNLGSLRRSLPMPWPLPPGPPVPDTAVDTAAPLLLDLDTDLTDMAAVGALYEVLLEHDLMDGRVVKSADPTRKATGTWYTPPPAAAAMCALALGQGLAQADELNPNAGPDAVLLLRAVDPACGAGVFLVEAARWLATTYTARGGDPDQALTLVIDHCISGADIDPIAVDLAATTLWWELHGRAPMSWIRSRVQVQDTLNPQHALAHT